MIFDSLNLIACIDLSLQPSKKNRFIAAPGIGEGFEDIAIDHEEKRVFCVIETMEDTDGKYRGFVSEYDREGKFQRCERLETAFTSPNKGFEGLAFLRRGGKQILYAMCEGNLCTDAKSGGGRIQAFTRTPRGKLVVVPRSEIAGECGVRRLRRCIVSGRTPRGRLPGVG